MLSKDLKLEKWKGEDDQPPLPPFTGETKIKLHFPEDAKISFFANLFPTNELFEMTAHQKKPLCTSMPRETLIFAKTFKSF